VDAKFENVTQDPVHTENRGITTRDRKRNTRVRSTIKVADIVGRVKKCKWHLAGHSEMYGAIHSSILLHPFFILHSAIRESSTNAKK
jgi:hypothetical protein